MKWRHLLVLVPVALLFLYLGYVLGRWQEVPGDTDTWKTFAQPVAVVFGALLTLVVGFGGVFGVLESSNRTQRDNRASREQIERDNRASREQIERENRAAREQMERENRAARDQTERIGELNRCWERFVWLVERTSGIDGETSDVFPPEVVSEVVRSLVEDATKLGDETLVAALTEYQQVIAFQFAEALDMAIEATPTQNEE